MADCVFFHQKHNKNLIPEPEKPTGHQMPRAPLAAIVIDAKTALPARLLGYCDNSSSIAPPERSPIRRSSAKKRRKGWELSEEERRYCPFGCGKFYRKTSHHSMTRHLSLCIYRTAKTSLSNRWTANNNHHRRTFQKRRANTISASSDAENLRHDRLDHHPAHSSQPDPKKKNNNANARNRLRLPDVPVSWARFPPSRDALHTPPTKRRKFFIDENVPGRLMMSEPDSRRPAEKNEAFLPGAPAAAAAATATTCPRVRNFDSSSSRRIIKSGLNAPLKLKIRSRSERRGLPRRITFSMTSGEHQHPTDRRHCYRLHRESSRHTTTNPSTTHTFLATKEPRTSSIQVKEAVAAIRPMSMDDAVDNSLDRLDESPVRTRRMWTTINGDHDRDGHRHLHLHRHLHRHRDRDLHRDRDRDRDSDDHHHLRDHLDHRRHHRSECDASFVSSVDFVDSNHRLLPRSSSPPPSDRLGHRHHHRIQGTTTTTTPAAAGLKRRTSSKNTNDKMSRRLASTPATCTAGQLQRRSFSSNGNSNSNSNSHDNGTKDEMMSRRFAGVPDRLRRRLVAGEIAFLEASQAAIHRRIEILTSASRKL
eukprot:CAMPEP_0167786748 /NCGR_PEP_ID=MMETSP0111_2-20121227/8999_1 /TAXON_ID=91324 /ORGANISM="Lotharella globosa, Strain CCCM811" /LENGTH=590 /DNA_ID=CAMNT_0007678233 /DNA_START=963 /DNA_END=2735 /DNA_ORIENTATION=+